MRSRLRVRESGSAQGLEGLDGVVGRVIAPEGGEDVRMKGLHPEADAVGPESALQLRFSRSKVAGFTSIVHSATWRGRGARRGRAGAAPAGRAEEAGACRRRNRRLRRKIPPGRGRGLVEEGLDEGAVGQIARRVLVEAAVGAKVVAEGDVEVEVQGRGEQYIHGRDFRRGVRKGRSGGVSWAAPRRGLPTLHWRRGHAGR